MPISSTDGAKPLSAVDDVAALISEIPPQMLGALKRDSLILLVALLGLELACSRAMMAPGSAFALDRILNDLVAAAAGIGFLVSIFKYPILLGRELRHRRLHGKWRWDRWNG